MSFVIQCPCGQQMTVQDEHLGREVQCVRCRSRLTVPASPPPGGEIVPAEPASPLEQIQAQKYGVAGGVLRPHRGPLILTLGILGFFCCGFFTAIPAWIMGNADLQEMKMGTMDRAGEGLTVAGRILGIVEVAVSVVVVVFYGAVVLLMGGIAALSH